MDHSRRVVQPCATESKGEGDARRSVTSDTSSNRRKSRRASSDAYDGVHGTVLDIKIKMLAIETDIERNIYHDLYIPFVRLHHTSIYLFGDNADLFLPMVTRYDLESAIRESNSEINRDNTMTRSNIDNKLAD